MTPLDIAWALVAFVGFAILWRNRNKRSARIRAEQIAEQTWGPKCPVCGCRPLACECSAA